VAVYLARMAGFGAQLAELDRFVDAARMVCEETRRRGAEWAVVTLHFDDGRVALAVDNAQDLGERDRLRLLDVRGDDLESLLYQVPALIGDADDRRSLVIAPLVADTVTCGLVIAAAEPPATRARARDVAELAAHLSVWCAQHGIGSVDVMPRATLGPRQRRVADLAMRGLRNGAIAAELGISVNTVKARLKEVFVRLGVRDRTALVRALPRLAPLHGTAPGISRLSTVTVTRAAHHR
jgi:DNA-binding CsgD family transcriptional regulator